MDKSPKPMIFLPGVRKELLKLPQQVRDDIGEAVWIAQNGMKAESAKPLTGSEFKGGKVLEIVSNFDKDTYRGVYTIEFEEAIYLVDAFEKKAKKGIAIPQRDINRIVDRLTSLREARKSPEGKARIAKLLEDRKRQQAEIDAKKESKNDI
jgi:phage-related protein